MQSGEAIAVLNASHKAKLDEGEDVFARAVKISPDKPQGISRIYARVNADGVSYFEK